LFAGSILVARARSLSRRAPSIIGCAAAKRWLLACARPMAAKLSRH